MQLPKIIRDRHAGISHPTQWTQSGACHWEKIAGWNCLVDEAGKIHQVHGDTKATGRRTSHRAALTIGEQQACDNTGWDN